MDYRAERLHQSEEIDRRPAPKMTIHLIDARIDHFQQAALCGQMVGRSGCLEVAPVGNDRVTVCPACQTVREAAQATTIEPLDADDIQAMAVSADFLAQALSATHTTGEPETLCTYRDRDGASYHATPTPQTVAVRTITRRRVTTTYPDGTVAQGWETLSESTAPYTPRPRARAIAYRDPAYHQGLHDGLDSSDAILHAIEQITGVDLLSEPREGNAAQALWREDADGQVAQYLATHFSAQDGDELCCGAYTYVYTNGQWR